MLAKVWILQKPLTHSPPFRVVDKCALRESDKRENACDGLQKSENAVKRVREHKERPTGVVADWTTLTEWSDPHYPHRGQDKGLLPLPNGEWYWFRGKASPCTLFLKGALRPLGEPKDCHSLKYLLRRARGFTPAPHKGLVPWPIFPPNPRGGTARRMAEADTLGCQLRWIAFGCVEAVKGRSLSSTLWKGLRYRLNPWQPIKA